MAAEFLYGLVGRSLGHSFSEKYFRDKFAREGIHWARYRNFEVGQIDRLPDIVAANPDMKGFNVTIPYKEEIIPLLSGMEGEAALVGAVNCVVVDDDGSLYGYNTDAPAFRESLLEFIGDERPDALILGGGGSSKTVAFVLSGLGIRYRVVSRTHGGGKLTYGELDDRLTARSKLIINTTPLGMYPETGTCPDIPYSALDRGHYLFDLIYNPDKTPFLRLGEERGAKTTNGLRMLVRQAELSWEIWEKAQNNL